EIAERFKLSSVYGAVVRRAIHSFPTRRSSDLAAAGGSLGTAAAALSGASTPPSCRSTATLPQVVTEVKPGARRGACPIGSAAQRSEAHTSELQSRGQLLCRRLPEKITSACRLI